MTQGWQDHVVEHPVDARPSRAQLLDDIEWIARQVKRYQEGRLTAEEALDMIIGGAPIEEYAALPQGGQ